MPVLLKYHCSAYLLEFLYRMATVTLHWVSLPIHSAVLHHIVYSPTILHLFTYLLYECSSIIYSFTVFTCSIIGLRRGRAGGMTLKGINVRFTPGFFFLFTRIFLTLKTDFTPYIIHNLWILERFLVNCMYGAIIFLGQKFRLDRR